MRKTLVKVYGPPSNSMVIKDNLIQDCVDATPYGESLESYIEQLQSFAPKIIDPTIEQDYDSYDSCHIKITGWREMTDAEKRKLEGYKNKNKQAKIDREEREYKTYLSLKKKYGEE